MSKLRQFINQSRQLMRHPWLTCTQFLIRTSAFIRKEIFEILRQPLLVLTLVLGPFLILLFFGIGYRNQARALRTLFVVDENSPLIESIEANASSLGPQLIYAGITHDMDDARERLRQAEVDLVTVVPSNPYDIIRNNQQAAFQLFHHEINPLQIDYVDVFGRVYVNAVNQRVLRFITSAGQVDAREAQNKLEIARASVTTLKELLELCANTLNQTNPPDRCTEENIRQKLQELDKNIDEVEASLEDNMTLIDAFERELGQDSTNPNNSDPPPDLDELIRDTNELSEMELERLKEDLTTYTRELETLTSLETELTRLEEKLMEFAGINPGVLISPFRSEAQSIAPIQTGITHFFAPAVIVLLLQHLTITFAALSMVREQQLGTTELFRVSPLTAIETLLGKYLSYLLFGGILALILLLLVVYGMNVPILGSGFGVALVVMALLFTSLGIGFIISLLSDTDIQAVQYAMIVLLTSVFFSGFILSLDSLWEPVRAISWALPATYGITLLRDIMLRGTPTAWGTVTQLVVIGLALFAVAWLLMRRSMENN